MFQDRTFYVGSRRETPVHIAFVVLVVVAFVRNEERKGEDGGWMVESGERRAEGGGRCLMLTSSDTCDMYLPERCSCTSFASLPVSLYCMDKFMFAFCKLFRILYSEVSLVSLGFALKKHLNKHLPKKKTQKLNFSLNCVVSRNSETLFKVLN